MSLFREQVVSPSYLREALDYDPNTGTLTWRYRSDMPRPWNARYVGTPAFTSKDARGYLSGLIYRQAYRAHRVIWAIVHGAWPDGLIDHINGDPSDNRISNLRVVTPSESNRNIGKSARNTSGCVGVSWHKQIQRWQAQIVRNRQHIFIGSYKTFEDAVAARKAAEVQYGFHPNHGRNIAIVKKEAVNG